MKFPTLKTPSLILRKFGEKKTDIDDLVEGLNNIEVTKWLLLIPYPYTKKDAEKWIKYCQKNYRKKKKDSYEFAIELKEEKKLIGGFGLSKINKEQGTANVGYWLNQKYHRKGYGSEALKAVLDLAFRKLKLRRIEASVFAGNPSSGKLLEKFGAKQEGIKRKAKICKSDRKIKDELIYGLLREEHINTFL
ncbi:MAG: GNAT family protein [Candidatus Pacearchaeota archaeon]